MTLITISQKSFETLIGTKKNVKFTDGSLISGESSELYEGMLEPCTKYYTNESNTVIAVYYRNLKGGIIK